MSTSQRELPIDRINRSGARIDELKHDGCIERRMNLEP